MASASKWCSVCRSSYRSTYGAHAATAKHRHNARPAHYRRGAGDWLRERVKASSRLVYKGEGHIKVRKYRRSRPNDGIRRVVRVRRYWRMPAGLGPLNFLGIDPRYR